MQSHVVALLLYMHAVPAATAHIVPGVGAAVGHVSLQAHVVPPLRMRQLQLAPAYAQLRPALVHIDAFVGSAAGQVPQVQPLAPQVHEVFP
jgi:hypothetical protein